MSAVTGAGTDYLARASLLRLLGVMALVIAPHLAHLPIWASAVVVGLIAWRAAAALRQWPLPPLWLKLAMALGLFGGLYAYFGRSSGQTAGTALLTVMLCLKLTEMRARRDVLVVLSLCYFLLLTHFLFSQALWTIAYLFGCAVAITAMLMEANHAGRPLAPRVSLRRAAIMVAEALPLMLALFVLFPRIPGPLWGLPSDSGAARSGLSDSMAPGDIAHLIQSNEVAFRVRFDGKPPRPSQMYWRGPVFDRFDGQRWSFSHLQQQGDTHPGAPPVEYSGEPVSYALTLEPHRQRWLMALDLPDLAALPPASTLTHDFQLRADKSVSERMLYHLRSYPDFRVEPELDPQWRAAMLELPLRGNPRTRALAQQWRAQGASDEDLVQRALRMYREQTFFYTLEPPILHADPVDEFLFDTRRGFCEHYASSFTVLMRAAGIPARVVTGYQGGDFNNAGGYFVVSQSDAHAWSEVWLADRGWVRVDPTAAVAPSRIESGIAAALAMDARLPGFLEARRSQNLRYALEARWDMINAIWDSWVLAYGPSLQQDLLSKIGLGDWQNMIIALTVLVTALMGVVGAIQTLRARPAVPRDRALRLWRRALRTLARAGLEPAPSEGPMDFAARVARERPADAASFSALARVYVRARYFGAADAEHLLERLVRGFRLARAGARRG